MVTEACEINCKARQRSIVSAFRTGWCGRFGTLCLILAATAMTSLAQDEPASTNSVKFTNLVNFDCTDGCGPAYMALVQGTDGNLYGTASAGGTNRGGDGVQGDSGGRADNALQLLLGDKLCGRHTPSRGDGAGQGR